MKLMLHRLICTAIFIGLAFSNAAAQNCEAAFSFDGTDITIQFFDESTSDPGDPILSWSWNFDDGTTSNEQNPEHTFPAPDNYEVSLTITTQSGCTSTITIEIETCVLNVSLNVGDCDASGEVPLTITVMDPYDAAIAINISIDGQLLPGSPFDIDEDAPVTVNTSIAGDGLEHTLLVQSEQVGTCNEMVLFTVPDCSSDCFLGALSVSAAGGNTHIVEIGDNFFNPSSTTITVGDLVDFQWVGDGHTTTSDATSGPDSWNSGELNSGASYQVDITNPGVHPYYCIPHGGPGGVGMAGNIVANCPPSGQFTLVISFNTTQADPAGYNLIIDGSVQPGSPFSYNGTGQQSVQASLPGDGQQHTIEIQDVANPSCTINTTWLAPDCGAAPTCSLSLTATENGACNASNQVPADLTVSAINPGNSGFNVFVDGAPDPNNPYTYDASGTTNITIMIAGDGQSHIIEVIDVEDPACAASTTLTTTDCSIPCVITNLNATSGSSVIHTVEVLDFDFSPADITITSGDIVEWVWVGAIGHTTTSDATSGPDSWDSGLLSTGATYQSPVLSAGVHPYYCIPHGAPGGVGMAGTITVQADCTNGLVSVNLTFDEQGGSANGFTVLVDGNAAGSFNYGPSGTTSISVDVAGDGQEHTLVVSDAEDNLCADTILVTTPDCAESCMLSDPLIEMGATQTHIVDVLDFEFAPKDITVEVGDRIRWEWVGAIPHTVTSDATAGPDSFNSGLLGQGAVFEHTLQEAGEHPYYCIPHGGPGGIGMAGTITAAGPCADGMLDLNISFTASNTGISGYNVFLDGALTTGSPYDYATDSNNSFMLEVPGDGASHELLIVDVDMPDCSVQASFVALDCEDPCFGFEASFESELNHTNLTADFSSTTENAVAWAWMFGDGNTSTGEAPSHTYPAEGHYEICLTATDAEGCTDTVCNSIFIGAYLCEPAFSFEGVGLNLQFADESVTTDPVTSWGWYLSDGTMLSEEQHPLISFDTLGIYELCLTIEAGDCVEDTCMTLDLSAPCLVFIPDFSYEIDVNTLSVEFTDLSTGNPDQWLWGFGNGSTSNEQNPSYTYQAPGTYNVCLLVQNTDLECNEAFCQLVDIGITGTTEVLRGNQPLLIYPNPSAQYRHQWTIEGILRIDYRQKLLLRMYDAAGQLVYKEWTQGAGVMSINNGEPLSTGVYFVEMRSENAVYRTRLVIQ